MTDQDQIQQLTAQLAAAREVLKLLHDNLAEYQRINNLGGYDNHDMRMAREALATPTPAADELLEDKARLEKVASLFENCRNLFRFNGSIEKPNPDSTFREAIDIARSKASTKEGA